MDRMDVARSAALGLVALAALALLVAPAAAQGAYQSTTEELIDQLNLKLLYVAVPITLLVEVILLYAVLRFRNNDEPMPTRENRRLEITWTAATALVLLFVGVASYQVLASVDVTARADQPEAAPDDAVKLHVIGNQWFWDVRYPDENLTLNATGEFYVPADRPVYIYVRSNDVIHAFHVPDLALKQDGLPGQWNVIRTTPTEEGNYHVYCAEFCGAGHAQMGMTMTVASEEEYRNWLREQRGDGGGQGGGGNETATATPGGG